MYLCELDFWISCCLMRHFLNHMDRNGQCCRTRDASAGDSAGSTLYNVNELFPCLQTLLRSILENLNCAPLRRECNV